MRLKKIFVKGLEPRPKDEDISFAIPYHLRYNGKTGYAQFHIEIAPKFFFHDVLTGDNKEKISRIMKVTSSKPFSDFNGTCMEVDFKRTDWHVTNLSEVRQARLAAGIV